MNTKEAVARYGLWATIAGCAAHSRYVLNWSVKEVVKLTKDSTGEYLSNPEDDGDYNDEALRAIAARSRSRPK